MRRSRAVPAFALLTSATLLVGACGSGGDGTGAQGPVQNNDPGKIGGQDELFKRPKVDDIGEIAVAIEEGF
ncbi:ABC transporter family substrate-binding protein, partial [Actinosynnema sp. NPDC023587]